jgi:hypothetical protein
MDKQYSFVNKALSVEGLEAKDGKITLTAEQVLALNKQLQASEEAAANAATAQKQAEEAKTAAETAKTEAENSLSDVLNKLDAIDPAVKAAADVAAKVTAIRDKLAGRPGTKPETPQGNAGKTDLPDNGADWDAIDQLPHNRVMDEAEASFS